MMYDIYKSKPRELRVLRIRESTTPEEIYAFLSLSSQYAPNPDDSFQLDIEYCKAFSKSVEQLVYTKSSPIIGEIRQHFFDVRGVERSVVTGNSGDYLVFLDDGRCRIFTKEELEKDYDYSSTQPFS